MSIECSECERDARGGHSPDCSHWLSITSVGYSRLVNLGNYENEKVNASARVEDGQDPAEVLAGLRGWVEARVTSEHESYAIREKAEDLRWKIEGLERDLARAKQKWEAAQRFLAAHGVDLGLTAEDLPF